MARHYFRRSSRWDGVGMTSVQADPPGSDAIGLFRETGQQKRFGQRPQTACKLLASKDDAPHFLDLGCLQIVSGEERRTIFINTWFLNMLLLPFGWGYDPPIPSNSIIHIRDSFDDAHGSPSPSRSMLYTFIKHLMVKSRFASAYLFVSWTPSDSKPKWSPNHETTRFFFGGVKEAPLWIYLF